MNGRRICSERVQIYGRSLRRVLQLQHYRNKDKELEKGKIKATTIYSGVPKADSTN